MKRRAVLVSIIVVAIAGAAIGGIAWTKHSNTHGDAEASLHRLVPVRRSGLSTDVSATGNLSVVDQVDVYPDKSGVVDEVLVKAGDEVKAGDVLIRLKQDPIDVQQAEANVRKAQEDLASADEMLRKMRTLHSAKAATDKELKSAEVSAAQAQDNLKTAKLKRDSLVTRSSEGPIRSPINGVVGSVKVASGNSVSPTALVCTIVDPNRVALNVTVDEYDIAKIQVGQNALVTLDVADGELLSGTVSSVGKVGTVKNGVVLFEVEISIDDPGPNAKPGMSADASISVDRVENALVVPNSALEWRADGYAVRVQSADGGLEYRMVETGLRSGSNTEIVFGLSDGDVVAVPDPKTERAGQGERPEMQGPGMPAMVAPSSAPAGHMGGPGDSPGM